MVFTTSRGEVPWSHRPTLHYRWSKRLSARPRHSSILGFCELMQRRFPWGGWLGSEVSSSGQTSFLVPGCVWTKNKRKSWCHVSRFIYSQLFNVCLFSFTVLLIIDLKSHFFTNTAVMFPSFFIFWLVLKKIFMSFCTHYYCFFLITFHCTAIYFYLCLFLFANYVSSEYRASC